VPQHGVEGQRVVEEVALQDQRVLAEPRQSHVERGHAAGFGEGEVFRDLDARGVRRQAPVFLAAVSGHDQRLLDAALAERVERTFDQRAAADLRNPFGRSGHSSPRRSPRPAARMIALRTSGATRRGGLYVRLG
jgi:hypothetical protein